MGERERERERERNMPADKISARVKCGLFYHIFLHFMKKRAVYGLPIKTMKIIPRCGDGFRSKEYIYMKSDHPMFYFSSSCFKYSSTISSGKSSSRLVTLLLLSICLSKLLLMAMDIESNPGPQFTKSLKDNLKTYQLYSYNSILKLEKLKLRKKFLLDCRENKCIPNGLKIHFNLAWQTKNEQLVNNITNVLSNASSRILDFLIEECSNVQDALHQDVDDMKKQGRKQYGPLQMCNMVSSAKKSMEESLKSIKSIHHKKITKLKELNSKSVPLKGESVKLISKGYVHEQVHSQNPSTHKIRNHRKNRHRNTKINREKKQKEKNFLNITADDYKRFDPIVLASNVTLTEEQIEICRLSDCFAPTPTEPIDVADQLIGTYDWAERLRWHYYFSNKKEQENNEENLDDEDIAFHKKPWYKRTTKKAPKGNTALEAFIEACTNQFLDFSKRNKIRDNLSKKQRKALQELKNLPITHNAACRYADKEGRTVITPMEVDDQLILEELNNKDFYDILPSDPTQNTIKIVKDWITKWSSRGTLTDELVDFITPQKETCPGNIKPLIKTHKKRPYPYRLLLSGSGTPTQALSKFVQQCICHLTETLPFQVLDTKEFLEKIENINEKLYPLPDSATFAVCDVVSLFPNVDNNIGIPATLKKLKNNPGNMNIPIECILEALKIVLNHNCSKYIDGKNNIIFARPNHGTAMGPCHSCDFVDIYMGELDELLTKNCPIPLLSSITPCNTQKHLNYLDWSRYRDDGIALIPDKKDLEKFINHLQSLSPENIKWTIESGREAKYLDLHLKIMDGKIITDVNSKHCHSYLNKNSCHPPSVFKGLLIGVGTRLRMLCSEDDQLVDRLKEYAKYFSMAGWKYQTALKELQKGASQNRQTLIRKQRNQKPKKIAWVTTYDPRVPSKTSIIKNNLQILYSNVKNRDIFPIDMIISADKKRKNLGQIFKPTVPKRFPKPASSEKSGFFTCNASRCDTCAHSNNLFQIKSPWDGRKWYIRKHLTCSSEFVIYIIRCKIHPYAWYVGSAKNMKLRWANHKSDCRLNKITKCNVAKHVSDIQHPVNNNLDFLEIHAIDSVSKESDLLRKELFWQANLGTVFKGLNSRMDLHSMMIEKNRIIF